jgi:hypothetical protein
VALILQQAAMKAIKITPFTPIIFRLLWIGSDTIEQNCSIMPWSFADPVEQTFMDPDVLDENTTRSWLQLKVAVAVMDNRLDVFGFGAKALCDGGSTVCTSYDCLVDADVTLICHVYV